MKVIRTSTGIVKCITLGGPAGPAREEFVTKITVTSVGRQQRSWNTLKRKI
jgi:hypothetical protein